jgi:hypothetical protein
METPAAYDATPLPAPRRSLTVLLDDAVKDQLSCQAHMRRMNMTRYVEWLVQQDGYTLSQHLCGTPAPRDNERH